jgi:hypothetical protein
MRDSLATGNRQRCLVAQPSERNLPKAQCTNTAALMNYTQTPIHIARTIFPCCELLVRRDEPACCLRMKVPHGEGLATHTGLESCAAVRKFCREALIEECAGMVLSLVRSEPGCRRSKEMRKAIPAVSLWRDTEGLRGVRDPAHARKQYAREPGDPLPALGRREGRDGRPKGVRR